jgi:VCBS repeat-containing protein
MSKLWNTSKRRKDTTPARRLPKRWRPNLSVMPLEDRTVPSTFTMTNANVIMIPGDQVNGIGPASPDPSTITASGLTGVVTHLAVTLNNLSHQAVDDIDARLVAPDGTNIYLMSDNGGQTAANNVTLTFDSSATTTLGNSGISSGTYAPFNFNENDSDAISNLPPNTPAPVTTMGIGGFYGINPNGTWGLYINDDTALLSGQMAGGWTLTFDYRLNSAPVANPDTYGTNENTPLTVSTPASGVTGNDTDADGDTLHAHLVTGTSNGSVTLNPDGTFTYTPNRYFFGTDSFTYRDDDGVVYGNTATVTINVAHVNQPPLALNDTYTLQNGGAQVVPAWRGVLANDVDPDGAIPNTTYFAEDFQSLPLQAFPLATVGPPPTNGIHGGAKVSNGTADWSPDLPAGWTRDNMSTPPPSTYPDGTFDTGGETYYGWHVMDIDSWIAEQGDQSRSSFQNEFQYPGFSAPSTGSHNHILVADGDSYDDYESLSTNHMNTYAYLPPVNLKGGVDGTLKLDFDSSFRPEDPSDGLQQATVDVSYDGGSTWTNLLTMDNSNGPKAPYSAGDLSRVNQHITLNAANPAGAIAQFRFGYLDASNEWWWSVDNINVTATQTDQSTLTAHLVTAPQHGSLTLNPNGSFTYTATGNYTGPDSFTYTTSDGMITTAPATVNITVNANNTAPVPVKDAYKATQNLALNVAGPSGVLVNDSDPDTGGFDGLTTAQVAGPSHGTLAFNLDGSFLYTPTSGYFGPDSFTYQLSDSVHTSSAATVNINVVRPNLHAPVAGDDSYSLNENGVLTTTAANGIFANDTDADGDTLSPVLESKPQHGTLTLNGNGSFTYTPHQFYYGPDSFTYVDYDGVHFSNVATVNITVNQTNVAPAANLDAYTTPLNTPLTATVTNGLLTNDRDDGTITTLMTENFDELPLQPFDASIHKGATGNANGDWTDSLPTGWTRDNQTTPAPSLTAGEVYYGWHVLDIDSWIHEQTDQARSKFQGEINFPGYSQTPPLVGSHNHVLVADGDAYDDYQNIDPGTSMGMNTLFTSPSVSLAGLNQNSLTLEFDSSFRPEEAQEAKVQVSYDGGTNWATLLDFTTANSGGSGNQMRINDHITLDANNPAGATNAVFRWAYLNAGNDWWWAIDNIKITGSTPNPGATLTAAVASQPHHGAVTINPNGAFTYTPATGFAGLDSFTYTASDGTHVSTPATAYVLVGNSSLGVQVNDGSAQRSEVRSLTIEFNGTATFAGNVTDAFELAGVGALAGNYGDVTLTPTVTAVNGLPAATTVNGLTVVTLTFSGTAGIDAISALNGGAPSLADGRYQLSVFSSQVNVNGQALDGDNDGMAGGDYVSPTDTFQGNGLHLYRLFGDVNGDGVVDATDVGQLKSTFNRNNTDPFYLSFLDADNSGAVDAQDIGQFKTRFNVNVFA